MKNRNHDSASLSEVHGSIDVTRSGKGWRKWLAFFGPAYMISVGYMDPGNWATDLAGGSRFGYSLLWVLLMSNLMALLLQSLSTRLGIVRGKDLAQCNHEAFPAPVNLLLYVLAEIAIAATDLAEVLGMAIGIHLLTGLPLIWGVAITILDTLLLLFLQRLGIRKMEAFILSLVIIVGLSFLTEILLARPDPVSVAKGLIPGFANADALYIAIGIIGATVMPHNLYLHSALVQTRKIERNPKGIRDALKGNFMDSAIALNIAFLVNSAILIMAAKVFFETGRTNVAELKEAHSLLHELLGTRLAPMLFAVALIAAGQSSTVTGTLAGQVVMEGYLQLRINPWIRRLLTRLLAIIPAVAVIYWMGDGQIDKLLVLSQVILSLQLGFAIIPLIHFVSDKPTMGDFALGLKWKIASWLVTALLVYLNIRMVINELLPFWSAEGQPVLKLVLVLVCLLFGLLLLYITLFPFLPARTGKRKERPLHRETTALSELQSPVYHRIAIALDFSSNDEKLLSHAIGQGRLESHYLLIHVVESASARLLGENAADQETRSDQERLDGYVDALRHRGYTASAQLGFYNRAQEIARIVKEEQADLLVIGAHGHSGLKDWIYGETINSVRHELKVPLLVVNL